MDAARLSRTALIDIYRKRAQNYDFYAKLFPLAGMDISTYRKKAIQSLALQRGDTVVDIGCGTGLNFPLLQEAIGPPGTIIGVDLSDAMLAQARQRVCKQRWSNVLLVQSDVATFGFPPNLDGILSTFAITLVPEYDDVVRRGCAALKYGKRWAIADFKLSSLAPAWLTSLLAFFLIRPFGGTLDMASRHPWESVARYMQTVTMTEFYLGYVYVVTGEHLTLGSQ